VVQILLRGLPDFATDFTGLPIAFSPSNRAG
jgi:hypothetical protein